MRNSDEYKKQSNKQSNKDASKQLSQDKVTEAALESFPASDPPAWTAGK